MARLIDDIARMLPEGFHAREGRDGRVYLYDDSNQPPLPVRSLAEAMEAIEEWHRDLDDGHDR